MRAEDGYDALIVVSFGGPEGPDDVVPFLDNVLRGRNVPPGRVEEVAGHYREFGGVSPINAQNRALVQAIEQDFADHDIAMPVYFGNRNWHPFLSETVESMTADGVRRALAFVTSAFSSYSGCRQYREDIARAREAVGKRAPVIDKIRPFFNHPHFIEANAAQLRAGLGLVPASGKTVVLFTAHSIPLSMAEGCAYEAQLEEAARLVAADAGGPRYRVCYQSRSGPPSIPWLEPDVGSAIRELAACGVANVVVSPLGFVSDHMEVVYDLDREAKAEAVRLGMGFSRVPTVGTSRGMIATVRALVTERLDPTLPRQTAGSMDASPHVCRRDCCLAGR